MYQAVLLDIDGTLVDSNDAHAESWVRALAESGRRVEFARVRPLIGMGSDKVLRELAGVSDGSPVGRCIVDRRREIFLRDFLPNLQPTRGAQRLLEWLRDERLKLVIATSAADEELDGLLRIAGATKLVDETTTSDAADHSKPDPDIVHAALQRSGCDPRAVVMIGDTPYDIDAARRAGVGCIALRCRGWWSDDAFRGALAIYDDPEDLLDRFDLSPFKRPAPAASL